MRLALAPSYKAICFAILKNDHSMQSLGFSPRPSPWYMELKRIEISQRC
jgi:predicted phosphoadenosine phosphosulfate sulfurtransferase